MIWSRVDIDRVRVRQLAQLAFKLFHSPTLFLLDGIESHIWSMVDIEHYEDVAKYLSHWVSREKKSFATHILTVMFPQSSIALAMMEVGIV
jgi:hypothetical protein